MKEKEFIQSFFYDIPSKIHGHLAHDKWPDGKIRWHIYSIVDIPCQKMIVGSTTSPTDRWRNYKSSCNSANSNSTGLAIHFKNGCPHDVGRSKTTLDFTLLDHYDTTQEKLIKAKHEPGAKCRCKECENLKSLEDRWITKLGNFQENGSHGLNSRNELKSRSRYNWN